jgi:PQQ-dependent dehydrogenase (methanol/ethanol family)
MKSNRIVRTLTTGIIAASVAFGAAQTFEQLMDPPAENWPQHGRDVEATRFSPLAQINTDNVSSLSLSWARDLGFRQSLQGSPAVWDGVMYVSTQTGVIALDATNGDLIWTFSSPADGGIVADSAVRGSPVVFDGKVFINTRYGATVAIDAETGDEIWRTQLTDNELNEGYSTNPIFADGKLVTSSTGADSGGSPGKISALSIEDGEVLWSFFTVPQSPEDPAFETWTNPPSWEGGIGGGSAWNAGAYDPVARIVVYGTGQPTPWDRIDARRYNEGEPTEDLYTASFVALDIDTGELKWYHQIVRADEWDYDQHIVPIFADLDFDGETRRTAVLATTTGYVVVVDTESGEMLDWHPIAAEHTVHLGFDENSKSIINPDARYPEEEVYNRICPGLRWAHIAPGAFSPETGLLYRPNQDGCINMGAMLLPDDWQPGERAWFSDDMPRTDDMWFDRLGALTAIDPVSGEVVWEFAHHYGHNHGPVVTAGGLVFTASHDRYIRAFDASNGEELWKQAVTTGSTAGTITYAVDGKQYVASLVGLASLNTGSIPDYNPNIDQPLPVTGSAAVFVFALP